MAADYLAFVRRVGLSVATSAAVQLRNIALLPVLTQQLDVAAFGAWSQVLALVELSVEMALLSLNSSVMRFLGGGSTREELGEGLASALVLVAIASGGTAAAMYLSSEWLAHSFFHADRTFLLHLGALLIPITALERVLVSFFRARLRILSYSLFTLAEALGYVAGGVVMVQLGFGVNGVVAGLIGVRLLLVLVAFATLLPGVSLSLPRRTTIRAYLEFGLPLTLVSGFTWVTGLADRYVIGYFMGEEAVGIYSVSYTLGMVSTALFSPVFVVLIPTLVHLWEADEREALLGHLNHSLRYGVALSLPAVAGLASLARPVVTTVSSEQYYAGWLVVAVVGAGLLVRMLSALPEQIVALLKRTRVTSAIFALAALFNLGANFALIPLFGIDGAAVATLLAYGLQWLLFDLFVRRHGVGVPLDLLFVAKCGLATVGMVLFLRWVPTQGAWLAAAIVGGAVVYVLLLLLLQAFRRTEIDFWRRLLRPRAQVAAR